ncbi:MAG: diaminopropionate ammonia-lyase [Rhodospirillaceae bacterium]
MPLVPVSGLRHQHNPKAATGVPVTARVRAVMPPDGLAAAKAEIGSWPGYAETPLRDLAGIARAAGLGALFYKDESPRFGLGSFKALGGAYAVNRLLKAELAKQGIAATTADLLSGKYAAAARTVTVTTATDGNHGRSVAWGAHIFGCACVIYIHGTVSPGRERAIAALGAQVVRVDGNYDATVRQAAADAEKHGRFVVSDTSYPGYMQVPRDVMQGYTLMADEAFSALAVPPTHIFIQGGVGAMAAAVAAQAWEAYAEARPRIVVVEPENAACLLESAAAGHPMAVGGSLETVMAGLACGEVSLLAWEVLEDGGDDYLVVSDAAAIAAMKLLADGACGDAPFVAGESAVAGLAGCLAAAAAPAVAAALGLGARARVLVFGSEGATDPETYARLVGRTPQEVAAAARSA